MKFSKIAVAFLVAIVPALAADSFNYVNWTGSTATTATGAIGAITVNYSSSDIDFVQTGATATPWLGYAPTTTWQGGLVSNAPANAQIIAVTGAAVTHTITFSQSVTNVAMDIVSLGQVGLGTQYVFSAPFTIQNQGASNQFGGGTLVSSPGNTLTGNEGNGVIVFAGPLTTLTWTGANPEGGGAEWGGFTFAIDAVTNAAPPATPVPSSILLTLVGLIAAGAMFAMTSRRSASRA